MADIKIDIEVNTDNGNITYHPAVCHATADDRIGWRAKGDWAIQFTNGTPLKLTSYSGHAEKVTFDNGKVRPGVQGVFHYAVAVTIGKNVYLDAGCPTIVIN